MHGEIAREPVPTQATRARTTATTGAAVATSSLAYTSVPPVMHARRQTTYQLVYHCTATRHRLFVLMVAAAEAEAAVEAAPPQPLARARLHPPLPAKRRDRRIDARHNPPPPPRKDRTRQKATPEACQARAGSPGRLGDSLVGRPAVRRTRLAGRRESSKDDGPAEPAQSVAATAVEEK